MPKRVGCAGSERREPLALLAKGGVGEAVSGTALVSRHPFSPRYDLNRATGVVCRAGHELEGQSIADRVLIVPAPKGGVAAGWALYELKARGIAPRAMVFTTVNPVFVQGAVHAGIPILHGFSVDPVAVVSTGCEVHVDPGAGTLFVYSRAVPKREVNP